MDISKAFADPKLEAEGVWRDYIDGSRVKIARIGNRNFQNAYQRAMQPYRDMERRGRIPAEVQTEILCRVYAKTILLDWDGFTDGGEPLPYSEENAKQLLMAHMDFRDDVTRMSNEEEFFKTKTDEESEKNSQTVSDGT